jgi:hypothetical protein
MVPILNHSLFIKMNNNITLVIILIVIENGLEIKIFLPLRITDLIKTFFLAGVAMRERILPFQVKSNLLKIGLRSCSGPLKYISLITFK